MAEVRLDENFLREYMRNDEHLRENIRERLITAGEYWEARARKRTGFMAASWEATVVQGLDSMEGVLEMSAHYASYQEYGTRYIEGMHLTQEMTRIIRAGR